MRRYEMAPEAVLVTLSGDSLSAVWERITADSPESLLDALADHDGISTAIAAIDLPCEDGSPEATGDRVIALSAVLAQRGVRAIETRYAVAVGRVFATYRAIQAGQVKSGEVTVVSQ